MSDCLLWNGSVIKEWASVETGTGKQRGHVEWFEGYIEASLGRSDIAVLARRTKVVRWGRGHLACGCLGGRYHGVKGGCVGSGQRESLHAVKDWPPASY